METGWALRIPSKAETSVLSRGRVCTRACMRPPTRSRRAHAELEYMYNEDEAEDKGAGMWEDAPRNCRKGDELFARRSCLPVICQSVFHLDEKIWLRATKHWIMQRRGRQLVWKLCDVTLMINLLMKNRRGISYFLANFSLRNHYEWHGCNKFVHYSLHIRFRWNTCLDYKMRSKHWCLYVGK